VDCALLTPPSPYPASGRDTSRQWTVFAPPVASRAAPSAIASSEA
jgi:hypothetical protein